MTLEENRAFIRRFAEVWNTGNLDAVADYIAADYVRHDPGLPMPIRGPGGIQQLIAIFRSAFPDIHFTPEVMLAEGDHVAALWKVSGTHQGELMGIPATGKAISIMATDIYRLSGGKIAEQWVAVDNLGMMQQLGVIPMPGQS